MDQREFMPNMNMSFGQYKQYCFIRQKKEMREVHMCKPIRELYGKSADELLEMYGLQDSVPLDLSALLQKAGISVLPMDFSKIEQSKALKEQVEKRGQILGALICIDDNAAIFYSHKDMVNGHRYRFTIAHELAHCCITGEQNHIEFRRDSESVNDSELAANIFAGELLIPEGKLREIIGELLIPSINVLADIFAVSVNVMKARLDYLKIGNKIIGYST